MSYVSHKTKRGEGLKIFVTDTSPFKVGLILTGVAFDVAPELNGNWKVVDIKENEFVIMERETIKTVAEWCPNVTTIEYKK